MKEHTAITKPRWLIRLDTEVMTLTPGTSGMAKLIGLMKVCSTLYVVQLSLQPEHTKQAIDVENAQNKEKKIGFKSHTGVM